MKVKTIKLREKVALVEYTNNKSIERVWIPRSELNQDDVAKEVLRRGVKYGLSWSQLLSNSVLKADLPSKVEMFLRTRGIWTFSDLMNNPQPMRQIVHQVAEGLLSNIINKAKEYCDVDREE